MAFRNISVALTADVSGYEAALRRATTATRQFKASSQGNAPVIATANSQQVNNSTRALGGYKAMTQQVAKAQAQSGDILDAASKKGTAAQKHLAAAQLMVRDAMSEASGATNVFSRGLSFAGSMVKQLVQVSGGFMLIHGFVNMVSKGLRFMNDAFLEFDQNMVESMAIMSTADRQMSGNLESIAKHVSEITNFSPAQAAEGLYFLASAGLTAAQSIRLLPDAARFAQAGLMDLDKATEMLMDLQKAFNQAPDFSKEGAARYKNTLFDPSNIARTEKGMKRVMDVITNAAIDSNATIEQVGQALSNKLAAQAQIIGMTIEEAASVVEVLASRGIKGAVAGTTAQMAIRDLQRTALKKADAYKAVGIQVFDEKGEMKRIDDIVRQFETKIQPLSDAGRKQFFMDLGFQDKAVNAILSLMGSADKMTEHINDNMKGAKGLTQTVAERQMSSLKNQFKSVSNFFARLSIGIGKGLVAGWSKVTEIFGPGLKEAQTALKKLWDAAQPVVNVLKIGAGAALIASLTALADILKVVSKAMGAFPGLTAGLLTVFAANKLSGLPILQKTLGSLANISSRQGFGDFMMGQGGMFSRGMGKVNASIRGFFGTTGGKNPMSFMQLGKQQGAGGGNAQGWITNAMKDANNLDRFTGAYQAQFVKMTILRQKWNTIFKDGIIPIGKGVGQLAKIPLNVVDAAVVSPFRVAFQNVTSIINNSKIKQKLSTIFGPEAPDRDPSMRLRDYAKNLSIYQAAANKFDGSVVERGMSRIGSAISETQRRFAVNKDVFGFRRAMSSLVVNSSLGQKIATTLSPVVDMATKVRFSIASAFANGPLVAFSNGISVVTNQMAPMIASAFKSLPSAMSTAFSSVTSSIASNTTKWATYIQSAAIAAPSTMANSVKQIPGMFSALGSKVASGFKKMSESAQYTGLLIGEKFSNAGSGIASMFKSMGGAASRFFTDTMTQAGLTGLKIKENLTQNGIMGGIRNIGAAKMTAKVDMAKENAIAAQRNILLDLQAQKVTKLTLLEQLRGKDPSQEQQLKDEIALNTVKENAVRKTMQLTAAEETLAGVRTRSAEATRAAQASTAAAVYSGPLMIPKTPSALAGQMKSGAAIGAMALMMFGPGMWADWDARQKEATDTLNTKLQEFYNVDITKVLKNGTGKELDAATKALADEVNSSLDNLNSVDAGAGELWIETMIGWTGLGGTDGKDANARYKAALDQANELAVLNEKVIKNVSNVMIKNKPQNNPGAAKQWIAGMGYEKIRDTILKRVAAMGGDVKKQKDVNDAYASIQEDFLKIAAIHPDMGFDEIADEVTNGSGQDAIDAFEDFKKEFTKTISGLFDSSVIMDEAQAYAETMRSALETPAQVATEVQKGINEDLKKEAENSAKAQNDSVDKQIKDIEKRQKAIREAASDKKKKTKSSTRKEKIDDAADAEIAALDDQKAALQDNKKAASDYTQERQMSMSEYINGLTESAAKTQKFNDALKKLETSGATPAVIQSFRDMGTEGLPILEEFMNGTDAQVTAWVKGLNEEIGKIGEKPKATAGEIVDKAKAEGYNRDQFNNDIVNVVTTTNATLGQGKGVSMEEMLNFVQSLGPESIGLVNTFMEEYAKAAGNPQAQLMLATQFKELTQSVYSADNFYTDGFTDAMVVAMQAATGVIESSGTAIIDAVKQIGNDAYAAALKQSAELEALTPGAGTKVQELYYNFTRKRNKEMGLNEDPLVANGTFNPSQPGGPGSTRGGQSGKGGQSPFDPIGGLPGGKAGPPKPVAQEDTDAINRSWFINQLNGIHDATTDAEKVAWEKTIDQPQGAWKVLEALFSKNKVIANTKNLSALHGFAERHGVYRRGNFAGKIPMFAQGDVVNKPTLGVFGEAGPEVILPLSNRKRMIELLVRALGQSGGVPKFAKGGMFNAKSAMASTRGMFDEFSKQTAQAQASPVSSQARPRPASYDMLNASQQGPPAALNATVIAIPVPIESKTEWNFHGGINGANFDQIQAEANRRKRQASLV